MFRKHVTNPRYGGQFLNKLSKKIKLNIYEETRQRGVHYLGSVLTSGVEGNKSVMGL